MIKSILMLLGLTLAASAAQAELAPYKFPAQERVVVIADTHGDSVAFKEILRGMNLIDDNEQWTGESTYLVILGDMLDRGRTSRQSLDLLMSLEVQAQQAGGQVIVVLGNHELMVIKGDLRYFSIFDVANYSDFEGAAKDDVDTVGRAFGKDSKYGLWLAQRPAMAQVGDTLFAHGGIEDWLLEVDIDYVNKVINAWVRFFMGLDRQPNVLTAWLIQDIGPMWTRMLSMYLVPPDEFYDWLDHRGYKRLVVGHTPRQNWMPTIRSRAYGERHIVMDTGISNAYGGNLSALEITNDTELKVSLFDRPAPRKGMRHQDSLWRPEDGVGYKPIEIPFFQWGEDNKLKKQKLKKLRNPQEQVADPKVKQNAAVPAAEPERKAAAAVAPGIVLEPVNVEADMWN